MRKSVGYTKMTERGQVVIPQDIRKKLKIGMGTQFIVMACDGVIVLEVIRADTVEKRMREACKKLGIR